MTLDALRVSQGFWTSAMPEGFSNTIQFLASGSQPGLLLPGERVKVPIYWAGWVKPWHNGSPFNFNLFAVDTDNQTPLATDVDRQFDDTLRAMRPSYIDADAWDALCYHINIPPIHLGPSPSASSAVAASAASDSAPIAQPSYVGNATWGSYVATLDRLAVYLNQLGRKVTDVNELFGFLMSIANDEYCPAGYLEAAQDAYVPAPGLSLEFDRVFLGDTILGRFHLGSLGRGWTDNWDWRLETSSDGTVTVVTPTDGRRMFQPDGRWSGTYFSSPGDNATLSPRDGGGFLLQEADGLKYAFAADGKLAYVEDTNGNRITAGYTNGKLTLLTHSEGQTLAIAYDTSGHILSVTDPQGRATTYGYNDAGDHLTSVTTYDGLATTYRYSQPNDINVYDGAGTVNELTRIGYPDGTHRVFTYDLGFLSDTYLVSVRRNTYCVVG